MKLSLLICGQVRDRRSFERDLEFYLDWLKIGAIHRIVFSGWTSDLGAHSDLMHHMADQGIDVVLSEEPLIKSFGYTLHQTKALHHGLARFDADEWVLKSRTDKVDLSFDIDALRKRIVEQAPVGPGSPFSNRILVKTALLFQPFFVNDMMFAGQVRDLRLIAHHDLWYVRDHALINTEQVLFFSAFRSMSPCTEAFFSVNPGLQHGQPLLTREIYSFLVGDPLYQHAMSEYLTALDTSFTLEFVPGDYDSVPSQVSWKDFLDPLIDVPGSFVDQNTNLRVGVSDHLPAQLLKMPVAPGSGKAFRDMQASKLREADIRAMRHALCNELERRWPSLPNVCRTEAMDRGVRIISTRISLVG